MASVEDSVLKWLGGAWSPTNQLPLNLGQQIESFEADFASGWLFGKILVQYDICDSINTFTRKTSKEGKCHNFYQVEDALRNLKINFDGKLIFNVMNEERGAALKLLNMLRTGLNQHFSESDLTVTGLKKKVVDSKVKKVADLATKLPEIHKQYGVQGPTFKGVNFQKIENKLLKYEVARANLEKKAEDDDLAETNMLKSIQQQKRQDAMRKLKENQQFMEDWERTGKQNWRQNREKRAHEIARQEYFDNREVKIYKDNLEKELHFNTNDMQGGVEEFQENLRKLGVEENITIQEAMKRQEEKKGIPPGQLQNFSYAATMNKIKETKNTNEFAGKERERRNRKMKVDQLKIQESLDLQKKEEQLIQKLLAKQHEEQQEAYIRWRNEKCREVQTQNLVKKAQENEEAKIARNKIIAQQMKEEADAVQAERDRVHAEQKIETKKARREEKAKKRRVNIEIASEVIDLIMDVADEAHAFQVAHKDNEDELLGKDIWRNWMDIFTDGKKVSEQNIVIQKDEVVEDDKEKDPIALLLGGSEGKHPLQMIESVKNEPIYTEFLQYLSMCGALNMRLAAPEKWQNLRDIALSEKTLQDKAIDLSFLDEINVPQNTELGNMIEFLYQGGLNFNEVMGLTNMNKSSMSYANFNKTFQSSNKLVDANKTGMEVIVEDAENQKQESDFPNYHNLKLCLIGRACSGKKTQVQMIKEKYGDKITLFNMQDIVSEALSFVKPVKEDADPKAKGKGKAAEPTGDMFPGKDTEAYKAIAEQLLKQVQISFGEDTMPGKEVDLITLVSDDSLLINLFMQKLKLTFEAKGTDEKEVQQKMRDNIIKQKELLEQLEEARANEGSDQDLKGKGKGAKAPRSVTEIEQDIKALVALDIDGWMLVDFPRTINQAKLLENMFNGFKSVTDAPKTYERSNFEIWSKLTDPDSNTEHLNLDLQPQASFFDGIVMLGAGNDECMRRAQHRKIDPTNNSIYHMEDKPPAEDPKLTERLQDFFGDFANEEEMIQKIDHNHLQFGDNEEYIRRFYSEFGVLDQTAGKGIASFSLIPVEPKQEKKDTFENIDQRIRNIMSFKQIAQDRQYENLRAIIQAEEEAAAKAAEEATSQKQGSNAAASIHQESIHQSQAQLEQPSVHESEKGDVVLNANLAKTTSDGVMGKSGAMSKATVGSMGTKGKKIDYTPQYKIKLWEQMTQTYFKRGMLSINDIKKQKEAVTDCLNFSQSQFIQFLERPDDKQEQIDEFIRSFNQFSSEFPELRQDDQTKEELLQRVQNLSNSLWANIEHRKDESLAEIQTQSEEGWSVQEMRSVCKNMASLIEIEISKFTTVWQILREEEPSVELDAEIITKKMLERGTKPYDVQTQVSPILSQVVASLLGKMNDLFDEMAKSDNQKPEAIPVLEQERKIFTYRLALVNSWGLACLEEISTYAQQVYNGMDDWIVDAVAQENHNISLVLKPLNELVKSDRMKINDYEFKLQRLSIYNQIKQLEFSPTSQPLYLQKVYSPVTEVNACRFSTDNLFTLFKEIRQSTGERGSSDTLDQQSFVNMMMLAYRQGRVPLIWKYMNFSKISSLCERFVESPLPALSIGNESPTQYQSHPGKSFQAKERQWINWKKLMTHFALLNTTMPSEEDLESYKEALLEHADPHSNQFITMEDFLATASWFDKFEGKPDQGLVNLWIEENRQKAMEDSDYDSDEDESSAVEGRLDTDRLRGIKEIMFNIHRVKTGENALSIEQLIDTLVEISQGSEATTYSELMFGE